MVHSNLDRAFSNLIAQSNSVFKQVLILVPLLVVLKFNFVFFSASPVLFISMSSFNKTGRGSLWQAIVIACRAFGCWCVFML